MIKNIGWKAISVFVLFAGAAYGDEILNFTASGTFVNGDSLGGQVTIDVTTGNVTAANLTASGAAPYVFNTNVGQINNSPFPGVTTIAADSPNNGNYPILLLATPTPSLIGYLGGNIASTTSPVSGFFSDYLSSSGSSVSLASGTLTLDTPDTIVMFIASGLFVNGEILGGDVVLDTTTGNVIQANLTASGPSPQLFNTNVGQINDSPFAGVTTIAADSPDNSNFPILLLGMPFSNLIGYSGGNIASTTSPVSGLFSNYLFADDSSVALRSGTLYAAPEPSNFRLRRDGYAAGCYQAREERAHAGSSPGPTTAAREFRAHLDLERNRLRLELQITIQVLPFHSGTSARWRSRTSVPGSGRACDPFARYSH